MSRRLKYTPATEAEKAAHEGDYKLHGWVPVGTHFCALEDLRGQWRSPDPLWELHAPAGHIFQPDGLHSLLGFDQSDLADRLVNMTVERCSCTFAGCDEHWAHA